MIDVSSSDCNVPFPHSRNFSAENRGLSHPQSKHVIGENRGSVWEKDM